MRMSLRAAARTWLLLALPRCAGTTRPGHGSSFSSDDHPVARHVGVWSSPPAFPDVVPQNTVWKNGTATHDPAYMMQPQPLAGNGDIGLCFDGPPEDTTFHLSTTSFWSSNVAPDSSRPVPHYRYEFFTHTRIGTLKLSVPSLRGAGYEATQELQAARINATFSSGGSSPSTPPAARAATAASKPLLHHSSVVTATDSLVVTRLEVHQRTPIVLTLRHPTSWVYGPNLPAAAGVTAVPAQSNNQSAEADAPLLWMWRHNVVKTANSLVGAHCYVGGQRPVSQRFTTDAHTGAVKLADGRCLRLLLSQQQHQQQEQQPHDDGGDDQQKQQQPGAIITIGSCDAAGAAAGAAGDSNATEWVLRAATAPPPPPPPRPPPPRPPPLPSLKFRMILQTIGAQPPYSLYHCQALPLSPPVSTMTEDGGGDAEEERASCEMEAATACLADTRCAGFALCQSWHNGTVAELFTTAQLGTVAKHNPLWTLWQRLPPPPPPPATPPPGDVVYELAHEPTGLCVTITPGLNTLSLLPCATTAAAATRWRHNATSGHIYAAGGDDAWETAWQGGGKCITAVEPNPLVAAGLAVQLRSADGQAVQGVTASVNVSGGSASLAITLAAGSYELITAIETRGNCRGCLPNTSAVAQAAIAAARAAQPGALRAAHATWWLRYWNASSIDLGPRWKNLEGFYYGMQYLIGSATRPGRTAPGAWGPWATVDDPGWMGDYALNYNFEAQLFGVFSDNRPELAEPYFAVLENALELGKWRAGFQTWHSGQYGHVAGQNINGFHGMEETSPDGRSAVRAGFQGIELPIHLAPWPGIAFSSDWGQKSAAAFAAKPFIDFVDYTGNMTFLRLVAYPYCRLAAAFYESYATNRSLDDDSMGAAGGYQYDLLHSCANEGCMAAGAISRRLSFC